MHEVLDRKESRDWAVIENNAGQQLFSILHRPLLIDHPPVVVVMHGFASSKQGSNRCYVALAEALVKEGIATLRFDFRGSGDSEGSLNEASFEDLIADAIVACEHALTHEELDGERLGVFGASLGGSIAIEASARMQKTKALALWAPVASGELWFRDFMTNHPETGHTHSTQSFGIYRGVQLNPLFKEQFSHLFAYKRLVDIQHIPLLHMHGENDSTISLAHQQAFKKYAGPSASFVTYPGDQHSLGYAKAFPAVIQTTTDFLKRVL